MADKVHSVEKAAETHVWQYEEHKPEGELTVRVADTTQVVGPDGKLVTGGKTVTLPAGRARAYIAAGFAEEARKR